MYAGSNHIRGADRLVFALKYKRQLFSGYYYSNNNSNGKISTEVCERENLYLSGDFSCFSSSELSCVGTCERRTQGYFEVIKDEPGQSGYFWNMVKLNVSIPF